MAKGTAATIAALTTLRRHLSMIACKMGVKYRLRTSQTLFTTKKTASSTLKAVLKDKEKLRNLTLRELTLNRINHDLNAPVRCAP